MPGTRDRTATKMPKSDTKPAPTKRKTARAASPLPEPDLLSPSSTAHSLTPPPTSPAKRRRISPKDDFFDSAPTRPPPSTKFTYTIKPIDPKWMVDHVALMKEMLRAGRSLSPVGHAPLDGPSSSITLVGEQDDEEEEEEAFEVTRLPFSMRDIDSHPALLVKYQRNWFPAFLTGFKPVATRAEKEAKQRDLWEVQAHPATSWQSTKALKKENIMYLDDTRLADRILGEIDTQARQFLSDARTRSSSPIPPEASSPLPSAEAFTELDRLDQFRLIRPHLSALINESYAPAQWRIDRFYSELKSKRKSSLIEHIVYGDISEDEAANVFLPELERWALRGCKSEIDNPEPTKGSDRYNSLTIAQKRLYVQYILQPESLIRICLASYEIEDLLPDADPILRDNVHPVPRTPSESELYKLAKDKLDDLVVKSPEKLWARIINEIRMARAGHRRRLGLPEENLSAYEKEQALLHGGGMTQGWAGGRIRKAREYWQGDGKQRDPRRPKEGV